MAKSSRTIAYVIQPYIRGPRGLSRSYAQRCDSRKVAMRLAEQCAEIAAGASVSEIQVAADVDYCGDPRVIATFGDVPDVAA